MGWAAAAVIISAAGVGHGIYQAQNQPDMPDPMELARAQLGQQREASAERGRGAVPGARADLASRGLSGASPEFLANTAGQMAGTPESLEDILELVRSQMGGGGGFNA
jgi:hypothetical protein